PLIASLLLTLGLAACADHRGGVVAVDNPGTPPVGPSDQHAIDPVQVVNGPGNTPPPGGGGGGSAGGSTPPGGGGSTPPGGGGSTPPGGGGGGSGSPVPEPGTMLLVGTGLAGAALLRRRRQLKIVEG